MSKIYLDENKQGITVEEYLLNKDKMKVSELIKKLQEFPQDLEVKIFD